MAFAQRIITSNSAGDQEFTFTFDYIKEEHIKVFVNFVEKAQGTGSNEFQVITNTTPKKISLNTGLSADNTRVEIRRVSSLSTPLVDFEDGSTLTAADLDTAEKQSLFIAQELDDALKQGISIDTSTGIPTLSSQRLSNVADPVNAQDVVTKNYLERSGSITSTQIADGTIVNADVNASAAIAGTKISPNFGSQNIVTSGTVDGRDVSVDGTKLDTIETSAKDDQTGAEIKSLYEAESNTNAFTDALLTKLNAIEANAKDDQTVSEIKTLIAGSPLDASHLAANSVGSSEIVNSSVTNSKLADAELVTLAGMQSGTASKLADSTALTSDIADLNQLDGMAKQTTITDDDTKFPTSGAVVDFVAAQIAPIGGLEVVATDAAFPNTQPSSGVVISISDAGGVAFNGSGTSTTARTVGGSTVTINNAPSSLNNETLVAGVGLMVSSTGSGQIYNYHKILGKEDDIKQLSDDINDFNARYRVVSSNPTSNNDAGDLIFNTSTQKLLVFNSTSNAFEEAQSVGNFFISTLSPAFDGSTQDFTITNAPSNAQQIILSINGVIQKPNSGTSTPSEGFALTGSTVKLAAAPPTGSDYFAIVLGSTVNIGTPSDNTVTTAILQNGSVTNDKVSVSAAIAGSKISPDFGSQNIVTTGTLASGDLTLTDVSPSITFTDSNDNPDFSIFSNTGELKFKDDTNDTVRMKINADGHVDIAGNLDVAGGLDVTGADLTVSGGVDLTVQGGGAINGTGNLTIDTDTFHVDSANNRVGIGTISPAQIFHAKNTGSHTTWRIENDNADFLIQAGDAGANGLHFYDFDNSAYRMTITNSGDVGIGTNSPSNLLDVRGSGHSKILIGTTGTSHATGLQISHALGDGGLQQWQLQTDATADGNLLIRNATTGNKIMIFDSDVYGVSIGGIDPEKMFEIQASNNGITDATEARNTLRFRCNDSTTATNQPFGTILWTTNDSGNSSGKAAFITATDVDSTGNGQLLFGTGNPAAERMRINGDGNVFIGTTTVNPGFGTNSDPGTFFAHTGYAMHSRNSGTALFVSRNDNTGSLVSFNYNGGGQIADITTNGSSVSYGTGSDYRLKENITTLTNAITRLKNLKPSRFNFLKTPSITQDGFIAHEVQEVVPEAVTGVKDEVLTEDGDMGDKKGDPVMQNLDVAKIVPLLTAALQEAIAKIETLETKVAALEAA